MADESRCSRCGGPLDAGGSCPACLIQFALDAPSRGGISRPAELEAGPPPEIPSYRIVRTLGEGGMGIVYLAEQEAPLARRVALKVVRGHIDSRHVLARFEAEREALARMDHPAIARVYDAGQTADGRPYFAMEYVDGERITDYCDRLRLGTRERLEVFAQVCDGIQHAHQRGIIHRDIKPSNVLVALADGVAIPKIIDFGVAKSVEQRLTERTLFTELGVLIGTPEYMSPEQADQGPLDVDTRTDVYSLGVLLYELLTGALPLDPHTLRAAALGEVLRRIREEVPSRPSTRIHELQERGRGLAGLRRSDPATLRRQLVGDLDVITMKTLEKERSLRYGSAAELAADIRRHLNDEPVLARPPSTIYQIRKLIVRNRLPAAFAAALLLTLVGFSIWMSVLYRRSQANLKRALSAESEAAREAASMEQVSDFLVNLFEVSDPGESRGNSVTARELLDRATGRIESELAGQPAVQSRLLNVMGNVYRSLGLYGEAEKLLRRGVERRRREGQGRSLAESLGDLATVLYYKGLYDDARTLAREALDIQTAAFGPDHPEVATTLDILGAIDWEQGRLEDAEVSWIRCLEIRNKAPGPDSLEAAQARNNLGNLLLAKGKHAEAESMFVRAVEIRERIQGSDHPELANTLTNLAETYFRQGRLAEAEPLHRRAIAIKEKVLGRDHPDLATSYNNLGIVCRNMGKFEDAEALYRRTLEIRQAKLPADHPLIAWTWDNLGYCYLSHGKLEEAEHAYERALHVARRAGAEGTTEWGGLLNNLALLRVKQKRDAEAERLHRQALEIWERTLGPEHPRLAFALHNLGALSARTGRPAAARAYFERALAIREAALGADHKWTQSTRDALSKLGSGAAAAPATGDTKARP